MRTDQLLPGESILSYSDNGLLTLTTHRVRYMNKVWGQANFISIMLEKISSLQVIYISYPPLLVMGIIITVIGFMLGAGANNTQAAFIAIIIGLPAVVAYFVTRRHVCVIASDGSGKIEFRTEGMSTETLIDMMDKIERAKNDRVSQLKIF